jgi:hypothetical protein
MGCLHSNFDNFCESGFFTIAGFAIFAKPLLAFRAKFQIFEDTEFPVKTVWPRFMVTGNMPFKFVFFILINFFKNRLSKISGDQLNVYNPDS